MKTNKVIYKAPSFGRVPSFGKAPIFGKAPNFGRMPNFNHMSNYRRAGIQYFSLVPYYGGKYKMLPKILPIIQELADLNNCDTYAELFGGGGRVILNLDRIKHEFSDKIYNDNDAGICCLMQTCKDPDKAENLYDSLQDMEISKELFNRLRDEEVKLLGQERAKAKYILIANSFNNNMSAFNRYEYRIKGIDKILLAPKHLKGVNILNKDYRDILQELGGNMRVLKYLDPPYHPATRNQNALNVYKYEMSREEHQELVKLLCKSRCWILSGYDPAQYGCDDYKPLEEAGAKKISIGTYQVKSSKHKIEKEEFIWVKD